MHQQNNHALAALLAESLQRGHWRVACRRFLMLQAVGGEVPPQQAAQCEGLLARCSGAEVRKMLLDACTWARIVARAHDEPGPRSLLHEQTDEEPAQVTQNRQVERSVLEPCTPGPAQEPTAPAAPIPVRTYWQPVPAWLRKHSVNRSIRPRTAGAVAAAERVDDPGLR